MIIEGRKKQKQDVVECKTKTYTAVRSLAMKIGRK